MRGGKSEHYILLYRNVCCVLSRSVNVQLCNAIDCSPPGFSVHGDSPGKNIGVGCHALLQGIFLTQGSNPDLPHCRHILYCLSHQRRVMTNEYSVSDSDILVF